MALDFHLAKSEKDAPMKYSGVSFDETIHENIFLRNGLLTGSFKYFRRMEDYYKDAKYKGDEVKKLLSEIIDLEKYFAGNNRIINQLNEIKRVCRKAIDKKMNLWAYCD